MHRVLFVSKRPTFYEITKNMNSLAGRDFSCAWLVWRCTRWMVSRERNF